MKGKRVLITGATGMVGSQVLRLLLSNEKVDTVVSIGRRSTGVESPKLIELQQENFLDFTSRTDDLRDIDLCVYCLGVYQNQVSKEEFIRITCDYQKALTDVLEQVSPNLTFCLFSASGADRMERSFMNFAKVKGMAENLLDNTSFPRKYMFRPGYIHPTGERKPTGWVYTYINLPLGAFLFKIFPPMGIEDRELAWAMVEVGLEAEKPSQIFENGEMRAMVKRREGDKMIG